MFFIHINIALNTSFTFFSIYFFMFINISLYLPAFKSYYKDCPNARATANETIMLPTYPSFNLKNVTKTAHAVNQILDSSK